MAFGNQELYEDCKNLLDLYDEARTDGGYFHKAWKDVSRLNEALTAEVERLKKQRDSLFKSKMFWINEHNVVVADLRKQVASWRSTRRSFLVQIKRWKTERDELKNLQSMQSNSWLIHERDSMKRALDYAVDNILCDRAMRGLDSTTVMRDIDKLLRGEK